MIERDTSAQDRFTCWSAELREMLHRLEPIDSALNIHGTVSAPSEFARFIEEAYCALLDAAEECERLAHGR